MRERVAQVDIGVIFVEREAMRRDQRLALGVVGAQFDPVGQWRATLLIHRSKSRYGPGEELRFDLTPRWPWTQEEVERGPGLLPGRQTKQFASLILPDHYITR